MRLKLAVLILLVVFFVKARRLNAAENNDAARVRMRVRAAQEPHRSPGASPNTNQPPRTIDRYESYDPATPPLKVVIYF